MLDRFKRLLLRAGVYPSPRVEIPNRVRVTEVPTAHPRVRKFTLATDPNRPVVPMTAEDGLPRRGDRHKDDSALVVSFVTMQETTPGCAEATVYYEPAPVPPETADQGKDSSG